MPKIKIQEELLSIPPSSAGQKTKPGEDIWEADLLKPAGRSGKAFYESVDDTIIQHKPHFFDVDSVNAA